MTPTPAASPDDDPRTVEEPTTGRPILLAPQRQQRPMHTGTTRGEKPCPFCAGNEHMTPPTLAARPTEAWQARAFRNLYPAHRHHEVIAEGRVHREHPAELDHDTWVHCLTLWRQRIAALEQEPDVACAYFFKNVGALAGASIAHNHSQLLGLPDLPPRLALERARRRRARECPWCATLHSAASEGRVLVTTSDFVVLSPEPPKLPYETWLLPRRCDGDLLADDLDVEQLAAAFTQWFGALGAALDHPACNLWLHRIPPARLDDGEPPFHWHFELQPRTGQLAGLELGGDMYINSVTAQQAAARLRAGLVGA